MTIRLPHAVVPVPFNSFARVSVNVSVQIQSWHEVYMHWHY